MGSSALPDPAGGARQEMGNYSGESGGGRSTRRPREDTPEVLCQCGDWIAQHLPKTKGQGNPLRPKIGK